MKLQKKTFLNQKPGIEPKMAKQSVRLKLILNLKRNNDLRS